MILELLVMCSELIEGCLCFQKPTGVEICISKSLWRIDRSIFFYVEKDERRGRKWDKRKQKSGGVWCVLCERSEALQCCLIPSSFLSHCDVVSQTQTDFQMWTRAHTLQNSHQTLFSTAPGSFICQYMRFRLWSFAHLPSLRLGWIF